MKSRKRFAGAALLAFALAAGAARADSVPGLVNYQGVLRDSMGRDFAMGLYAAEFRLWTAPQGGAAVWGKQYAFNVITNGEFNVILGDVGMDLSPPITNALAQAIINNTNPLYLAIVVEQTPGGAVASPRELAPRQQWVSAPYALKTSAADSTLAVGGISGFFDIRGLDKTQLAPGQMKLVGMSNNAVALLDANFIDGSWWLGDLTVGGAGTANLAGGVKTDIFRGPSWSRTAVAGPVRMFATNWTQVIFGARQTPVNYDGWAMVQLPDLFQLYPKDDRYSIWITVSGVDTKLLCFGVTPVTDPNYMSATALNFCERCLTYPIPANSSWCVYSTTPYPTNFPVSVYYLGLKGPL